MFEWLSKHINTSPEQSHYEWSVHHACGFSAEWNWIKLNIINTMSLKHEMRICHIASIVQLTLHWQYNSLSAMEWDAKHFPLFKSKKNVCVCMHWKKVCGCTQVEKCLFNEGMPAWAALEVPSRERWGGGGMKISALSHTTAIRLCVERQLIYSTEQLLCWWRNRGKETERGGMKPCLLIWWIVKSSVSDHPASEWKHTLSQCFCNNFLKDFLKTFLQKPNLSVLGIDFYRRFCTLYSLGV